jgi:uncharacterized membrane protein (UPF0127 family)
MDSESTLSMFRRQVWLLAIILFFIAGAVILIRFGALSGGNESTIPVRIEAQQVELRLSVARTTEDKARGLSGRDFLEPNTGMIFVFEQDDYYGIWMKDMKFPIDVIWLDDLKNIVDVKEGLLPDTYPTVFYPMALARFVVELESGFIETHQIIVGDHFDIPDF